LAKVLFAVLFSVLLLVPVGLENVFAFHPELACPTGGTLNNNAALVITATGNILGCSAGSFSVSCPASYTPQLVTDTVFSRTSNLCVGTPTPAPTPFLACQNGATLDNSGHCVPELSQICSTGTMIDPTQMLTCIAQSVGSMIGGALLEINTVSLLLGSIGVNPVITGLVGITIAGVAGQAVWFVHRRKKKVE